MSDKVVRDLVGLSWEECDCYRLVQKIYSRLGIEVPDYCSYTRDDLVHAIVMQGRRLVDELPAPEPFCLVAIARNGYVTHLGVVLSDTRKFIHSMKAGVVIDRLDRWKPKIRGYYKWKTA